MSDGNQVLTIDQLITAKRGRVIESSAVLDPGVEAVEPGLERQVALTFNPISVGIVGAGGMMAPYHSVNLFSNPRIAYVVSVYGSRDKALDMAMNQGIPGVFIRDPTVLDGELAALDIQNNLGDQSVMGEYQRLLKTAGLDDPIEFQVYQNFLAIHDATLISTPNCTHERLAQEAFKVNPETRTVYVEKPSSNDMAGSQELVDLEIANPGRVGIVAHNRCWDSLLEMRHILKQQYVDLEVGGTQTRIDLGDITHWEVEYQQDYQAGTGAPGWRNLKGVVGELGDEADGILGKLIDILFHGTDSLTFATGLEIDEIISAYTTTTSPKRAPSTGPAFGGAEGDDSEPKLVEVGGNTLYHGDDVIDVFAKLSNGATGSIKVSQTSAGHKNLLRVKAYTKSGYAIEFDSTNANGLNIYSDSHDQVHRTRYADKLAYREGLAKWLKDGMCMLDGIPFQEDTPFDHDIGWRETHRRQAQMFMLYSQLLNAGTLMPSNRSELYMVPTASEAHGVMRAMKEMYKKAAEHKVKAKP